MNRTGLNKSSRKYNATVLDKRGFLFPIMKIIVSGCNHSENYFYYCG
jgi:hypothetical protein